MNKIANLMKKTIEIILVIGFIFFEELIWKKLALPIKDLISSLRITENIQKKIDTLGVYQTLGVFLLPLLVAELMGVESGILILSGSFLSGTMVYLMKIPVAGLTFWIFSLTKEKLLTIIWFKYVYEKIMFSFEWVKSTVIYRKTRIGIYRCKKIFLTKGKLKEELSDVYESMRGIFKDEK